MLAGSGGREGRMKMLSRFSTKPDSSQHRHSSLGARRARRGLRDLRGASLVYNHWVWLSHTDGTGLPTGQCTQPGTSVPQPQAAGHRGTPGLAGNTFSQDCTLPSRVLFQGTIPRPWGCAQAGRPPPKCTPVLAAGHGTGPGKHRPMPQWRNRDPI